MNYRSATPPPIHSAQCRCQQCRDITMRADPLMRMSDILPDPPVAVACLAIAITAIAINLMLF